jgi:opacity protein-like surface antigen
MVKQIYPAMIVGAALALAASAAAAQTSNSAPPTVCRTVNGQLSCTQARPNGAAGNHAYDRWQNGAPTSSAGSSATPSPPPRDARRFPNYIGGYNAGYGFGK